MFVYVQLIRVNIAEYIVLDKRNLHIGIWHFLLTSSNSHPICWYNILHPFRNCYSITSCSFLSLNISQRLRPISYHWPFKSSPKTQSLDQFTRIQQPLDFLESLGSWDCSFRCRRRRCVRIERRCVSRPDRPRAKDDTTLNPLFGPERPLRSPNSRPRSYTRMHLRDPSFLVPYLSLSLSLLPPTLYPLSLPLCLVPARSPSFSRANLLLASGFSLILVFVLVRARKTGRTTVSNETAPLRSQLSRVSRMHYKTGRCVLCREQRFTWFYLASAWCLPSERMMMMMMTTTTTMKREVFECCLDVREWE